MACDHRQWILGSSFCPFRPNQPSFISYIQIYPKIWVRQLGWLFPIPNKWKNKIPWFETTNQWLLIPPHGKVGCMCYQELLTHQENSPSTRGDRSASWRPSWCLKHVETCWSPLGYTPLDVEAMHSGHPRPPPWLCASSHVSFRSRPWCWPGTRELWGFNHTQPLKIGIECNFHEIFVYVCMYVSNIYIYKYV